MRRARAVAVMVVVDRITTSVLYPAVIDLEAVDVRILVRLVVDVFQVQLDVQPVGRAVNYRLVGAGLAEAPDQVPVGH